MTSTKPKRTHAEYLAYQAAYRERNKEKAKAYAKKYREANAEKVKADMARWLENNKDYKKKKDREKYEKNRDEILAYQKEYRKKNAEQLRAKNKERYAQRKAAGLVDAASVRERSAKWYAINKEKLVAIRKKWVEANRARLRLAYARHRNGKQRQTPIWANTERMLTIYLEAEMLTQLGFKVHVDHIIPLRGKLVSGLHVENNLQIIDGTANRRKGATFDPDTFDNTKVFPSVDISTLVLPERIKV